MQALDLNLATRPFKNNAPLWLGLVGSLIVLGLFTGYNVVTYREHSTRLADLSQRLSKVETERGELERREREARRAIQDLDLEVLATRTLKANEVIRWKAFSWTRLFNLLQSVQPHSVQMTAIRPIFRSASEPRGRETVVSPEIVPVSVEGTARGLTDFLAFEKALIDDPHFDRPEPENTDTDEQTRETVFRLRFWYDPRVPLDGRDPTASASAGPAEGDLAAEAGSSNAAGGAEETLPEPTVVQPTPQVLTQAEGATPDPTPTDRPRKRGGGRRKNRPPVEQSTEPAPENLDAPGAD